MVLEWSVQYPNTHFWFTAAVYDFSREQIQALRPMSLDKLLLETDSALHASPRERNKHASIHR